MISNRIKYPFSNPDSLVDILVIGGGCVGLAITRSLCRLSDKTTFLIERHRLPGQETSSRNSQVIHAGIYYPLNSLKTILCCSGRSMLYQYARRKDIPHKKVGKMVIATSQHQKADLGRLYQHSQSISAPYGPVPLQFLAASQARDLEPDLGPVTAALFSPETGIIDSHEYMQALENDVAESGQGEIVYDTQVVRIDPAERGPGWVVQTVSGNGDPTAVQASVVINAAGLNAHTVLNQILPEDQQRKQYFCKGSYFSYKGPGVQNVSRLLYPCPEKNVSGLGTHLTMDLAGGIRFGPDVEWLTPPTTAAADDEFWRDNLVPSEDRLDQVYDAVRAYLPAVERAGFAVDWEHLLRKMHAGIRPKLVAEGQPAADFEISHPKPGFINLMGIESPGLTSSLAIAEHVTSIVKSQVFGLGKGNGRVVSNVGQLDAWG